MDETHKRFAECILERRKKEAEEHPLSHCVQETTFPLFYDLGKELGQDINRGKILINILALLIGMAREAPPSYPAPPPSLSSTSANQPPPSSSIFQSPSHTHLRSSLVGQQIRSSPKMEDDVGWLCEVSDDEGFGGGAGYEGGASLAMPMRMVTSTRARMLTSILHLLMSFPSSFPSSWKMEKVASWTQCARECSSAFSFRLSTMSSA